MADKEKNDLSNGDGNFEKSPSKKDNGHLDQNNSRGDTPGTQKPTCAYSKCRYKGSEIKSGVTCKKCEKVWHWVCASLTKADQSRIESGEASWSCPGCHKKIKFRPPVK